MSNSLKMPGGSNEEDREIRREWERMRLADPATGEIPQGITFLERYFAKNLPMKASCRTFQVFKNMECLLPISLPRKNDD